MATYIGIDWGVKKIGIAHGDTESGFAFAGDVIVHDGSVYDVLIRYAQVHDADGYILGITAHYGHTDNAKVIRTFAEKLRVVANKPVILTEEMLSTREAQENLKSAGKKNIAMSDDAEAARIILQHYLDHDTVYNEEK